MSDEISHTGRDPADIGESLVYHAPFPSIWHNVQKAVFILANCNNTWCSRDVKKKKKQSE